MQTNRKIQHNYPPRRGVVELEVTFCIKVTKFEVLTKKKNKSPTQYA